MNPNSDTNRLRHLVEYWARASEVAPQAEQGLIDSTLEQIGNVFDDTDGRWLLATHPQHACELELTGVVDGEVRHHILDRTFVINGTRWIVDYKTDRPTGLVEEFVQLQASRYAAQLQRYAEVASAVFPEPVTAALYFTAIPRLYRLDPDDER